ncbi:MAG: hypothetical protein M0Z46_07695 [Actinomycetota bacterium]|jgi:hypothetical protein|nr:hypothetical protein [Actinomycetota bacterium]
MLAWLVFLVIDRKSGLGVAWAGAGALACSAGLVAWSCWRGGGALVPRAAVALFALCAVSGPASQSWKHEVGTTDVLSGAVASTFFDWVAPLVLAAGAAGTVLRVARRWVRFRLAVDSLDVDSLAAGSVAARPGRGVAERPEDAEIQELPLRGRNSRRGTRACCGGPSARSSRADAVHGTMLTRGNRSCQGLSSRRSTRRGPSTLPGRCPA